jgi:hypothetical protein
LGPVGVSRTQVAVEEELRARQAVPNQVEIGLEVERFHRVRMVGVERKYDDAVLLTTRNCTLYHTQYHNIGMISYMISYHIKDLTVPSPEAVAFQIEWIASCLEPSTVELTLPINATDTPKLPFAPVAGNQVVLQDGVQLPCSPLRGCRAKKVRECIVMYDLMSNIMYDHMISYMISCMITLISKKRDIPMIS